MAFPTIEVSVSFTTGPYATPTWVNITSYVNRIKIKTGRSRELEGFQAGTLSLELDNYDRRFDPFEATGPYYGNLKANKQVRVRATWSAVTYDMFYGFIDGWPVDYSDDSVLTTTVTATDAFKLFTTQALPSSVYETEVLADSPNSYYRFNETTGTTFYDKSGREIDGGIFQVSLADVPDGGPLTIDGERSIKPAFYDAYGGGGDTYFMAGNVGSITGNTITVEAWVKSGVLSNFTDSTNTEVNAATFALAGQPINAFMVLIGHWGGQGGFNNGGYVLDPVSAHPFRQRVVVMFNNGVVITNNDVVYDGKIHHIAVAIGTTLASVRVVVDGALQAVTVHGSGAAATNIDSKYYLYWLVPGTMSREIGSLSDVPEILVSDFASYPTALGTGRIQTHYNAGHAPWDGDTAGTRMGKVLNFGPWPAGLRDIDAGINVLGYAQFGDDKLMDYLRRMESSEQGQLYINHRDGGKVRLEDHQHRMTDSRATAVQYTFTDATPIAGGYRYARLGIGYEDHDLINRVDVKWQQGTETVTDATSVTDNGERKLDVSTELPNPAQARSLGEWITSRYATPVLRCKEIEIEPTKISTDHYLPCLAAKISDRVHAHRMPRGATTAVDADVLIEGIEHEIGPGVSTWKTTFRCSDADTTAYWVWGTSTWGSFGGPLDPDTARWGY